MIDIAQHPICKVCGKPIVQKDSRRGHRKRSYCSDRCRQIAYRQRKEQPQSVTIVTIDEQGYQARIAELEQEVQTLRAQLNLEERLRTDVVVRHFKNWLRRHPQPEDTDFAKRVLADTRLPLHATRSLYEARLRLYKYSEEDIALFRDVWKTMLLSQS
jgi:endogenous inhibitor of DNA gyrase (YacG/DUF329 family)